MSPSFDFDYIVIGSGFGGSVSAFRLTEKGYRVGVMEMGRRWTAEDFPKSTFLSEILFNIPTTAHCMGGCAMADSPERGVMDVQNRVFGYQNFLVCDGSMLSANLGVNPSLTITALTEHAMSYILLKNTQSRRVSDSIPLHTHQS